MGKANATSITANAQRSFPGIEYVIMVGIAGGCPNAAVPDDRVRLGDIVHTGHAGVIEYD
jgi:nucleoside phosphorylase